MNLIKDWIDYNEKNILFPQGYFYTLFHNCISELDLKIIFQYFENSEDLELRMKNYLRNRKLTSNFDLKKLVKKDIDNKTSFLKSIDALRIEDEVKDYNFAFITKESVFKDLKMKSLMHIQINEEIGDSLINSQIEDSKVNQILDSFYGLTTDYNLVWYLGNQFYKNSYNPDIYFELWDNSGDYVIDGKDIFILNKINLLV